MKVKLRAKAGQGLQIIDENGKEIEGLEGFVLHPCSGGELPAVTLRLRGIELQVDAEAEEAKQPAEPAPGGDSGATGSATADANTAA
jgi:hypothetical protein